MNCPCGTQKPYEECCGPLHEGAKPETAEELMRSRYSAFVKKNIDYIGATHLPGTTDFDPTEAKDWADNSIWNGLEIVKTEKGQKDDKFGVVEFKALYSDKNDNNYVHHEIAKFKKQDDTWYYDDGQIVGHEPLRRTTPKVGRNEPCVCGSGKKFKKCCGK